MAFQRPLITGLKTSKSQWSKKAGLVKDWSKERFLCTIAVLRRTVSAPGDLNNTVELSSNLMRQRDSRTKLN
jgi:hypothetical protein